MKRFMNEYCKRTSNAVALMKSNIEEPMSCEQIAVNAGISVRQMQRLFRKYFGQTPQKYYVLMRLQKARSLTLFTDMKLIDISIACGFSSTSNFAQSYRRCFDISPSKDRAKFLHNPSLYGNGVGSDMMDQCA